MYYYAQGQIRALSLMNEGDSVRLYIPPSQGFWGGYGFTYSTESHFGYSPSSAYLSPDMGMIFDMRLNRIIKDIYLYEREEVERYAAEKFGITNPADSVVLGVYAKKTVENPDGEAVKGGSVVDIYYAGRFLDGHVFDTNDTEVAEENHVSASGSTLSVAVGSASVIPAMDAVLLGMRAGERASFVTVSDQAYGMNGSTNETYGYVVIPPYTPLVFDIYVESVENVEEDE
jgi:FKBP-type peptidyl-prolyl cis-trans isomerase